MTRRVLATMVDGTRVAGCMTTGHPAASYGRPAFVDDAGDAWNAASIAGIETAYPVGDLALRVTGGNERAMRKLLNDAGAAPALDEYRTDPGELVARSILVDLLAMRAGDRVARILADVLREE